MTNWAGAGSQRDINVPINDRWSPKDLRQALGRFTTGVTIIAARSPNGGYVGLTANSFTSLSLDPALVLWSLGCNQGSRHVFERCSHFAVNILSEHQADLSTRFASPVEDRFSGVGHSHTDWGVPLIHGCAAWFICSQQSCTEIGDHLLFVGRVEALGAVDQVPLLFHGGRYAAMRPAMDS
ncbi:MAG: flavin reductase family protein [Xanthobacteraceae bacterium]